MGRAYYSYIEMTWFLVLVRICLHYLCTKFVHKNICLLFRSQTWPCFETLQLHQKVRKKITLFVFKICLQKYLFTFQATNAT